MSADGPNAIIAVLGVIMALAMWGRLSEFVQYLGGMT